MIPTRALIVGAGVMGHRHATAIRASGDEVTAVVDLLPARAEQLAPRAKHFGTVTEVLMHQDIFDVAVIASPSKDHLIQAQQLAISGYPVLVEKPHRIPGQVLDEGADWFEEKKRVFVGMTTRHWPGVVELGDAIASGRLGKILSYTDRVGFRLDDTSLPPWYFDRKISGGGILLTNGVHAIDRARAMLQSDLSLKSARLTKLFASHECEDSAEIRFVANGEVLVDISLSWLPYEPIDTGITVIGAEGSARIEMDGSWQIATISGIRSGGAIDIDVLPFQAQWAAFLAGLPGFGLIDLEPTLMQIEKIYRDSQPGRFRPQLMDRAARRTQW